MSRMETVSTNVYGGYPLFCVVEDPYDHEGLALIYPGDNVYYGGRPRLREVESVLHRRLWRTGNADEINSMLGVTPGQVAAMKAGVEHGWDDWRANPAAYDARGKYIG